MNRNERNIDAAPVASCIPFRTRKTLEYSAIFAFPSINSNFKPSKLHELLLACVRNHINTLKMSNFLIKLIVEYLAQLCIWTSAFWLFWFTLWETFFPSKKESFWKFFSCRKLSGQFIHCKTISSIRPFTVRNMDVSVIKRVCTDHDIASSC